jgi:hypothetical protein
MTWIIFGTVISDERIALKVGEKKRERHKKFRRGGRSLCNHVQISRVSRLGGRVCFLSRGGVGSGKVGVEGAIPQWAGRTDGI